MNETENKSEKMMKKKKHTMIVQMLNVMKYKKIMGMMYETTQNCAIKSNGSISECDFGQE